jgi:hypothetical protein
MSEFGAARGFLAAQIPEPHDRPTTPRCGQRLAVRREGQRRHPVLVRQNHEINRIEDLRIERLEFVHLHCPRCEENQEVTALITFRASVYFVDDRTGAYTRGSRLPSCFQEFWTFGRQGDTWLLQTIEQSHESDRLERPNFVADLTEEQLANAQHSITL